MQLVDIILDRRISCTFIDNSGAENVIFCRPLEESLNNISLIATKSSEFIHSYIEESSGTYLVTYISLEDGTVYENVRFKLISVEEDAELPSSTIDLSALGIPSDTDVLPPQILEEDYTIPVNEVIEEEDDFSVLYEVPEVIDNSEIVQKVKALESKLIEGQQKLEKEKQELNNERELLEVNKKLEKTLEDYKSELLVEYYNATEAQKQQLIEYLDRGIEKLDISKKIPIVDSKIEYIDSTLSSLVKEHTKIQTLVDESRKYTDEQIKRTAQNARDFARRILDLGGGGGSNAVQYANGGTMNGNLNVTGQYLSAGVNIATLFGSGGSQTLSFNSTTANLSISNGNTVSLSALSGSGGVANLGNIPTLSANWNNSYTTLTANSANWTVAYTTLTANSANWNNSYTTLTANSANWTVAYTTLTANSANWNNSYTTLTANSANWNNSYTTLTANSANWNNSYTTLTANSANWQFAYTNQSNYLPLSGGTLTGSLVVNSSFAAQTKSFLIDHPSKEGRKLQYGSLESPYHGIRLTGRGSITTNKAIITLPDYIKDLVYSEDVNIQITNIGHDKMLYIKSINIDKNQFVVGISKRATKKVIEHEFFWSFTAVRKDTVRLQVEI